MKERPIIFSGDMVRAILDGRKTQTRRKIKGQPSDNPNSDIVEVIWGDSADKLSAGTERNRSRAWAGFRYKDRPDISASYYGCPYGKLGDRLWVREAHAIVPRTAYAQSDGVDQILRPDDDHDAAIFREGWERSKPGPWRSPIHMPRWASRILLEITDVRVERLQDISEGDAKAEGSHFEIAEVDSVRFGADASYRSGFQNLWQSINGADSWDDNPWVWVVEFKQIDAEEGRQ